MPRNKYKKNKSNNNCQPQNVPYYPNHFYNMNQQYHIDNNDYNYNTNGKFIRRYNNQTGYQNSQVSNVNYQFFNNTRYTNWGYPNEYMNAYTNEGMNTYTNEGYYNRGHTNYRDYSFKHTQAKPRNSQLAYEENMEYWNSEISGDSDRLRTETTGNKIDNLPEKNKIDNLPENNKIDNLHEINKIDNLPKINNIDNLPEINNTDNMSEINGIENLSKTNIRPPTRTILRKRLNAQTKFPDEVIMEKLNYTDNFWKKGKETDEVDKCKETEKPICRDWFFLESKKNKTCKKHKKNNTPTTDMSLIIKAYKFEKRVNGMLSAPVEMSKGRSLLEKMGWTGGGLGKDGEGIVEPIAPQTIYAATTMGLGQLTQEDVVVEVDESYYRILTYILEFVKNDLESELKFQSTLTRFERKRIHKSVEELRNGALDGIHYPYKPIVLQINHHNDYILVTQSDGHKQNRLLTLYKEGHEHMFIISPDDLVERDETTDIHGPEQTKTVNANIKTGEAKDESSQDASQIETENITNTQEEKQEEREKLNVNDFINIIIDLFLDFGTDPLYTEFRFLGPFDSVERCAIDIFFQVCRGVRFIERSAEVMRVFDNEDFYLEPRLNNNGKYVIYKIKKNEKNM